MAATPATPLNCIVDDSALVASVRQGSPHSIQPWLAQNAINVFVPLSALERLSKLRAINCPVRNDAQKALVWLDQVTSSTASNPVGYVQLQGPDDQYTNWQQVEQYLLPDTPFSRTNAGESDRMDALSRILDRNLNVNGSQTSSPNTQASKRSPSASPTSSASSVSSTAAEMSAKPDESSTVLSAHGIPPSVRPLLNFVVWRTHHEYGMNGESGKYILVTNDPIIQRQASKFGVRAKLLGQLENILAKDGVKPVRNNIVPPMSNGLDGQVEEDDIDDDEDRVVFDPSKRPGSSRGVPAQSNKNVTPVTNVIDPDHFGRSDTVPEVQPNLQPHPANNATLRGGRGGFGNRRGRPSPPRQTAPANHLNATSGPQRGRGASVSPARGGSFNGRGGAYVQPFPRGATQNMTPRGMPNGFSQSARGNNPGFRGRGGQNLAYTPRGAGFNQGRSQFVPKPIDPDSFARPSPFGRGRGRGGATHRLWEPTNTG
ncbi:MAG: hypothetical protein Q9162_006376 [Coniocarpon cinnabarinum]